MAAGDKKGDIARRLGKPGSFVSEHAAVLEAPDYLQALCESGRCTDVKTLYPLIKAHEEFPDQVAAFVSNAKTKALTRSDVNRLMQWLKQERQPATPTVDDDLDTAASEKEDVLQSTPERLTPDPTPIDRADPEVVAPLQELAMPQQSTLVVRHGGRLAYLVLPSKVEIRYQDTGEQARVAAETVEWVHIEHP